MAKNFFRCFSLCERETRMTSDCNVFGGTCNLVPSFRLLMLTALLSAVGLIVYDG